MEEANGQEKGRPYFSDPDKAREAALRGVELQRLKRENPEEYIRQLFVREKAQLMVDLLDAAHGRGDWHELAPDKRLAALIKALEYAHGRPTGKVAPPDPPAEPQKPPEGLTIE